MDVLYGLCDSTQCILIDISISCYQIFVVYHFVDVKINLIQCQCQCQVKKLLNELKTCKSPGPDGLHPRLLHELANEIYLLLSIIFEASMKSIRIPTQWKIARVSAINKKGNRKLASNYRPVSIVCRVLETIIRNFMVEFLVSNNLLSDFQFGFVKGRSTTLQLLNVLNNWTNSLGNKFTTNCIYLDYQKVFDSVPHKRLISKLRSYRFNPDIISRVENYLRDRSQYVEINGEQSQLTS